ncbi:MAG: MmcB family DNA repair protein, partial [Phycisphaerae bacterium]
HYSLPDFPVNADASAIARGLMRGLDREGWRCLSEVPLASGHRADVMALDDAGRVLIAEIKSSAPDFRADRKWRAYLDHCDLFAFAVAPEFPVAILPPEAGLYVCDAYG